MLRNLLVPKILAQPPQKISLSNTNILKVPSPASPQVYLTNSHGAAHGVVEAAHVVHLAAVGGVVEHRRGEEAEVVRRSGNVHGPRKRQRLTWEMLQQHPTKWESTRKNGFECISLINRGVPQGCVLGTFPVCRHLKSLFWGETLL